MCSFLLFVRFDSRPEFQYVLLGAILIFLVGIYDDLLEISPRKKVKGEMLGVLVLIVGGGFYLTNLHGFLSFYEISPWVGIPLTFVGLVGLINAINLIDGIDGLYFFRYLVLLLWTYRVCFDVRGVDCCPYPFLFD